MADVDLEKLSTATREQIIGDVEEQVFTENVLLRRLSAKGIKKGGGDKIAIKIAVTPNAGAQSYRGFEVLNTDTVSPFQTLRYDWKQYSVPISICGLDELINEGEYALFNLIKEERDLAVESLAQLLAQDIYKDGMGNDGKAVDGLANIVDDGTNYITIAGLSRNTYPVLKAKYYFNSGVKRTLTYKLANRSLASTLNHGKVATIGITTLNLFNKLRETAQPQQFISDVSTLSMGAPNIIINATPVFADENCTAERLFWLQERDLFIVTHPKRDFVFENFRKMPKQDAMVGYIWWAGNVVCRKFRTQAVVGDLDET